MSRVLKVSQGDYRIQVQGGGNIILDTGDSTGVVTVTGNLDVKGVTTTVESNNTTIQDNVLQLNVRTNSDPDYSSAGISSLLGGTAGIEILRGTAPAARLVFQEGTTHYDSTSNTNVSGTFVLETRDVSTNSVALSGLQLRTITTDGTADLIFDLQNQNSVIRIANSTDYHLSMMDDNDIPNKKYVNTYVAAVGGVASVDTMHYPLTTTPYATIINTTSSTIDFIIGPTGTTPTAQVSSSGFAVNNILIAGDTITDTSLNNLTLTSASNKINIDAVLSLQNQSVTPGAVSGFNQLYTRTTEGAGRTGIFFVNNTPNADELVSKNRSLLFSILF